MFALLCGQSCEKQCVNQVPASSVTQGLSSVRGNHKWGSRRSHTGGMQARGNVSRSPKAIKTKTVVNNQLISQSRGKLC